MINWIYHSSSTAEFHASEERLTYNFCSHPPADCRPSLEGLPIDLRTHDHNAVGSYRHLSDYYGGALSASNKQSKATAKRSHSSSSSDGESTDFGPHKKHGHRKQQSSCSNLLAAIFLQQSCSNLLAAIIFLQHSCSNLLAAIFLQQCVPRFIIFVKSFHNKSFSLSFQKAIATGFIYKRHRTTSCDKLCVTERLLVINCASQNGFL